MSIKSNAEEIQINISTIQSKLSSNLTAKGVIGVDSNTSLKILADKVLEVPSGGGSGVIEELIQIGKYYSAQSFLEQQLRDSYEITKDWRDYSKARGALMVYAPELNATVNVSNAFRDCFNLRISPNVSYTDMNAVFSDCANLYQFKGSTALADNWTNAFANCTSLEVFEANTSGATRMQNTFSKCSNLKTITGLQTQKVTNFSQMFGSCQLLTTINPINFTASTAEISLFNQYVKSNAVTTIVVEGTINVASKWWADNLSIETLRSIITALTDRAGQTALTISFTSSCVGRLTQQDKDNITNKNWTLATV